MKIIIAGAGEVGSYLARMLSTENHDITVIDNEQEENLDVLDSNYDLMTVRAYPGSIDTLKENGIKKTDLFIAVTPYETTNITATILAKRLGAKNTAARIDNMEYMKTSNQKFFEDLGIDTLIYPEMLAAKEISKILSQSGIIKMLEFSKGLITLSVIKLDSNAPIIGKTLAETSQLDKNLDFRAVAITRGSKTIIPHGNDTFQENDVVYVASTKAGINSVLKYSGKTNYQFKNVMILGGSRIGTKTAKTLEEKFDVKILELDKDKSFKIADMLDNTLVLNTDGTNLSKLKEEGIETTDVFIAVTADSETNILSCLLAKKLGVKKTIAEVENMDYIELAGNLGVESVINKKLIAASHIYRYTLDAAVSSVQCLAGTDAEILEFEVAEGALVTKNPLKTLNFPAGAIIGGIVRKKKQLIPKGDCHVQTHDKVVVFALPQAINAVAKYFKKRR